MRRKSLPGSVGLIIWIIRRSAWLDLLYEKLAVNFGSYLILILIDDPENPGTLENQGDTKALTI